MGQWTVLYIYSAFSINQSKRQSPCVSSQNPHKHPPNRHQPIVTVTTMWSRIGTPTNLIVFTSYWSLREKFSVFSKVLALTQISLARQCLCWGLSTYWAPKVVTYRVITCENKIITYHRSGFWVLHKNLFQLQALSQYSGNIGCMWNSFASISTCI